MIAIALDRKPVPAFGTSLSAQALLTLTASFRSGIPIFSQAEIKPKTNEKLKHQFNANEGLAYVGLCTHFYTSESEI